MNRPLLSERLRWLFFIALVAIGVAFTAKQVTSYPTECMTEEMAMGIKQLEFDSNY